MAQVRITPANGLRKHVAQGVIDLDDDTIKVALVTNKWTPDLDWPTWAPSNAYFEGDIVIPSTPTGHAYEAQGDGTSDIGEPTFPTAPGGGGTVVDNDITWLDLGLMSPPSDDIYQGGGGGNFDGIYGFVPLTAIDGGNGAGIWGPSTAYGVGLFVIPFTDTGVESCVFLSDGGTSAGTEPDWDVGAPLMGDTINDGSITWTNIGRNPAGAEAAGTGYTAGGEEILNKALTYHNRRATWDGDDVIYPTATVTARWAAIYKDGIVGSIINPYVAHILLNDTPADVGSVDADFRIKWNTNGILRFRAP